MYTRDIKKTNVLPPFPYHPSIQCWSSYIIQVIISLPRTGVTVKWALDFGWTPQTQCYWAAPGEEHPPTRLMFRYNEREGEPLRQWEGEPLRQITGNHSFRHFFKPLVCNTGSGEQGLTSHPTHHVRWGHAGDEGWFMSLLPWGQGPDRWLICWFH